MKVILREPRRPKDLGSVGVTVRTRDIRLPSLRDGVFSGRLGSRGLAELDHWLMAGMPSGSGCRHDA